MNKAAQLYEEEEYYIPELLICSGAMYNGLEILKPYLEQNDTDEKCKVVIGVVEGDTHDIGKNLVRIMLEAAGYETVEAEVTMIPENTIEISDPEQAAKVMKLIDALEDNDDVQKVHHNCSVDLEEVE